jgi:hypothetical protein
MTDLNPVHVVNHTTEDESSTPSRQRNRRKVDGTLDIMNAQSFTKIDPSWRDDALCKNNPLYQTDDFFYVSVTLKNTPKVLAIQKLCSSCPVAAQCLYEAMMFGYDGAWAGFSLAARNAYLREFRNNSVLDLTVDECADILDDMYFRSESLNARRRRSLTQFEDQTA